MSAGEAIDHYRDLYKVEHPKHAQAQHADDDMGFDPTLSEMKGRSYPEIGLAHAKKLLDFV